MHRSYENKDITVFWDSDKCFHAKKCVTGCPEVFDFQRRPWIDLGRGSSADIWQTVSKCPSGALSITYNHDAEIRFDEEGCRSVAYLNGKQIGECDYIEGDNGWTIVHTEVDREYGGKGIAKRLVYSVTEAAERRKKEVIPVCSYAVKVLADKGAAD
ncbi:MAG: GNAT family N-acetyltransferase [Lachnospiraceae bacterium]|nr:GNAT family N-acetyltransferase [Lachnospiraceae bacterium]